MNKTDRISAKDYQLLVNKKTVKQASKAQKISPDRLKELIEGQFNATVKLEYMFHPKRKWRIDVAVFSDDLKIAIELEGGVWTDSRHRMGIGYLNDIEKYNNVTLSGFKLLRYTHTNHEYHHILNDLKLLL